MLSLPFDVAALQMPQQVAETSAREGLAVEAPPERAGESLSFSDLLLKFSSGGSTPQRSATKSNTAEVWLAIPGHTAAEPVFGEMDEIPEDGSEQPADEGAKVQPFVSTPGEVLPAAPMRWMGLFQPAPVNDGAPETLDSASANDDELSRTTGPLLGIGPAHPDRVALEGRPADRHADAAKPEMTATAAVTSSPDRPRDSGRQAPEFLAGTTPIAKPAQEAHNEKLAFAARLIEREPTVAQTRSDQLPTAEPPASQSMATLRPVYVDSRAQESRESAPAVPQAHVTPMPSELPDAPLASEPTATTTVQSVITAVRQESAPSGSVQVREPEPARPIQLPNPPEIAVERPVREISVRIGEQAQSTVNLRVVERAGEVHVAVRTSTPELTSSLREQLPDLVSALDQRGFHAHTWSPGSSARQDGSETNSGHGREAFGQSGQHHPGGEREEQHRDGERQPAWVDELEREMNQGRVERSKEGEYVKR